MTRREAFAAGYNLGAFPWDKARHTQRPADPVLAVAFDEGHDSGARWAAKSPTQPSADDMARADGFPCAGL